MILVTGATGRVGYHVLEALADAGADITAMVRVEAKAADLPGAPEHVVAAFDDPPPAEVLRGFDRVFLLSPADEEQTVLETVFIDALVAAGHRRTSSRSQRTASPIPAARCVSCAATGRSPRT